MACATNNRRDDEAQSLNALTQRIIGASIEVHRHLGPGLLELAWEECVCYELAQAGIRFERQKPLPVRYKTVNLDCGYRLDLLVESMGVVELKTIEQLLPVREAQLLTDLRLADLRLGLLINFRVPVVKDGIRRIVNRFPSASASPRPCGELRL